MTTDGSDIGQGGGGGGVTRDANPAIPQRRYLTAKEAARWLALSVDTFTGLGIRYVDFGPRCRRWDIVDIEAYATQNKSRDSARTSETKRKGQSCDSTNAKARRTGGSHGTTGTESAIAEVLELTTRS